MTSVASLLRGQRTCAARDLVSIIEGGSMTGFSGEDGFFGASKLAKVLGLLRNGDTQPSL